MKTLLPWKKKLRAWLKKTEGVDYAVGGERKKMCGKICGKMRGNVEPLPSFLDSKNRKNIDLGRRGELKIKEQP